LTNTTDLTSTAGCIMSTTSNLSGTNAIAEALIVKGSVSPSDVTNLQNYWKKKFNL